MEQKDQKIRKYQDGSEEVIGALIEAYKGLIADCGYRADVVVEGRFILELKAIERLLPTHAAQVLTYMKLTGIGAGLLVNFNVTSLRQGLRRLSLPTPSPS